jgi:hypothetical protein
MDGVLMTFTPYWQPISRPLLAVKIIRSADEYFVSATLWIIEDWDERGGNSPNPA